MTLSKTLVALLLAWALPALGQSVPNANYSDMWWNPAESGWGVTIVQHAGTHRAYAIWYTYDPRDPDPQTPNSSDFKPLWFVMSAGTWSSPNTLSGNVYVTNGSPFFQGWNPAAHRLTQVGTFTFVFSDASHGTFTYNIAPPQGLSSSDPAFGLPALSGSKAIQRQSF